MSTEMIAHSVFIPAKTTHKMGPCFMYCIENDSTSSGVMYRIDPDPCG